MLDRILSEVAIFSLVGLFIGLTVGFFSAVIFIILEQF